ncbi:ABC transporter ATP-binding protein, partial [Halobacteriales archaeon QH_2_65_14]
MTHISLDNVSKYYDGGETVANYRLNLEIEDGEFLVLLGPSGCGKTTALRLIAGLETPSEGDIYFDDERVTNRSPSDRNVAMVFQNYALYPHMTVRENIAYPLKVRGIEPDERDRRIAEITELLHIEDLLGKRPAELSGGQRQRTALARAIVR